MKKSDDDLSKLNDFWTAVGTGQDCIKIESSRDDLARIVDAKINDTLSTSDDLYQSMLRDESKANAAAAGPTAGGQTGVQQTQTGVQQQQQSQTYPQQGSTAAQSYPQGGTAQQQTYPQQGSTAAQTYPQQQQQYPTNGQTYPPTAQQPSYQPQSQYNQSTSTSQPQYNPQSTTTASTMSNLAYHGASYLATTHGPAVIKAVAPTVGAFVVKSALGSKGGAGGQKGKGK